MSDTQAKLDALVSRMRAEKDVSKVVTLTPERRAHPPSEVSDEEILEKCRASKSAAKFEALFDRGDVSTHAGRSEADFALLGYLKFYTQDLSQLERLMRSSALARAKWDDRRGHRNFIQFNIEQALSSVGETYDWTKNGHGKSRPIGERHRRRTGATEGTKNTGLLSSSLDPPRGNDGDDNNEKAPEVVWFHELGEPKEREYLIEHIGVKGHPIVAFGAGGVAKSFIVLAGGIAVAGADGAEEWLGFKILDHGHVLYLDFELDVDEQHRRVRNLCAGMGVMVPKRLAYMSGVGLPRDKTFAAAQAFVEEYGAKAVVIDSVGLAMEGDMSSAQDVLAFHARYIDPLRRSGATPLLVDHQGKLQTGEKHRDKSPFGSAYKAWISRSVLQFELQEYDKEAKALDIRVRQTKTNFSPVDPLGVRLTFEHEKVSIKTYELEDTELVEEESVSVRDRIVGALRVEPATNAELQRQTGASAGTIRNNLSQLIQDGEVGEDGYKGRSKVYRLLSSSPEPPIGNDSDDNNEKTVPGLFANPPDWLTSQLKVYRENPAKHLKPLCAAVAAVVLGDGACGAEVREEVEKVLEEDS